MTQAQSYPLSWPIGWRRTAASARRRAQFCRVGEFGKRELSVADALARLLGELRRLGATDSVLSTNVRVGLNGLPLSQRVNAPADPGAALYFHLKGQPRCLACDKWDRVPDNLTAIAFHIRALRAVDRYGVGTLEQAFAGYTALPPGATEWWTILGVPAHAALAEIEAAFLILARQQHPDQRGGSHDGMARLTDARQAAREALR